VTDQNFSIRAEESADDPSDATARERMRRALDASGVGDVVRRELAGTIEEPVPDAHASWREVLGRIEGAQARSAETDREGRKGQVRAGWLGRRSLRRGTGSLTRIGLSASVLIALAATIIVGIQRQQIVRTGRPSAVFVRSYATRVAQRATVTLGDGSRVTLAPETRLRYSVDRTGAQLIELIGEGFFTVMPRTHRPFVVYTGAIATRVLGTAFDVRRYSTDLVTKVTVVSGRVTVGGHRQTAILNAGMIGRLTDSTASVSRTSDSTRDVEWTRGNLVFNRTPVPEMLTTLGRWCGYEFRLVDTTLLSRDVSIEFNVDDVVGTMNTLKALLGVTMTFEGNLVILRPERPQDTMSRRKLLRDAISHPLSEVGR